MRRILGITAMLMTVFAGATPASADAVYPSTTFYVKYGNSVTKGKVIWYNQSIGVEGTIKVASACKSTYTVALNDSQSEDNGTGLTCAGESNNFYFTVSGAGSGGYTTAFVFLLDANGSALASDTCRRGHSACSDG